MKLFKLLSTLVRIERRLHRLVPRLLDLPSRKVVAELRREGSFDLVAGQSLPRDRLGRGDLAWRFCAACAGSLIETESA